MLDPWPYVEPWDPRWDDDLGPIDGPSLEVEITPNPIVGVLYGPDGEVILEMRERSEVEFGFQPSASARTEEPEA